MSKQEITYASIVLSLYNLFSAKRAVLQQFGEYKFICALIENNGKSINIGLRKITLDSLNIGWYSELKVQIGCNFVHFI